MLGEFIKFLTKIDNNKGTIRVEYNYHLKLPEDKWESVIATNYFDYTLYHFSIGCYRIVEGK